MGIFGEGNFANDGALDYVNDLVDRLAATVDECLADEERSALDEEGEAVIMPSIEIIALLCEHCSAAPPPEETVNRWREQYLHIYDEEIDFLDPKPTFKEKRRAVIERTFERLAQLSSLVTVDDDESVAPS